MGKITSDQEILNMVRHGVSLKFEHIAPSKNPFEHNTAHSCRASSTSAASLAGIDIITITKSAGWSSDSTFYKHYKKDIILYYKDNFGFSLLHACRPHIA